MQRAAIEFHVHGFKMGHATTTHHASPSLGEKLATRPIALLLIFMLVFTCGVFFLKQRKPDMQVAAPSSSVSSSNQKDSASATTTDQLKKPSDKEKKKPKAAALPMLEPRHSPQAVLA